MVGWWHGGGFSVVCRWCLGVTMVLVLVLGEGGVRWSWRFGGEASRVFLEEER